MRSTPALHPQGELRLAPSPWGELEASELRLRCGIDDLLDHFASEQWTRSVFYDDPSGTRVLGFGCAAEVRLDEACPDRFERCARQMSRITRSLQLAPPFIAQLRWFGGAAFHPDTPTPESPWRAFGTTSWFLPQVLISERGGEARALLLASASEQAALQQFVQELTPLPAKRREALPEVIEREESADASQWRRLVERALAQLENGRLEKVVTARRLSVQLSASPAAAPVLRQLREQAVGCTVFALRFEDKIFLGASPELLVEKQGLHIHTDALAGTLSLSEPHAAERLMSSEKDRREHDFVVREITRILAPLCREIQVPAAPELLALRRMLHLRTPIRARLAKTQSVLDLVSCLHPTPAVGGLPTGDALRFLESEEGLDRGWYASPLGWVDAHGDGRFLVALRSALLVGSQCHLYAGAGIVRSSDPDLEFQETELKMGAMLGALGLGG